MTSAKPQSMAAQTEAPDDLIAELARLMADDARSDQKPAAPPAPAAEKTAPVRIPGNDVRVEAEKPDSVRIPGAAPAEKREPFNFDFVLNTPPRNAGPATPLPPVEEKPAAPASAPVADEKLDYDGLADLIAAELANDLTPAEPLPVAAGPARGDDNFGVPPVFGLGAPTPQPTPAPAPEPTPDPAPVAVEPIVESVEPAPVEPTPVAAMPARAAQPIAVDPLTDIERLLAPVVQKAQQEGARSPSPALRSLATPTLPAVEPRIEAPSSRRPEPGSVDDAILAAAAATGAQVEWVNSDLDADDAGVDELAAVTPPPRRGFTMSRAVAGPLVAVGLLAVAGIGLYWVLGQGGTPTGPAPLLVADNAPVKDVPEPVEQAPSQSVVFNEISGGSNPADEQIVPRDQSDVAALTEAVSGTSDPGILASDDGTSIDPNQEGLVNRKVRTVTVRPDGTIISGTDSMAGASILPVERPNVPEVPGADFSTPDLIASTIAAADQATPAAPAAETTPVPAVTPVASGAVVPVVDAAGTALAGRSVTVPVDRPADFAQLASAALAAAAVPPTGANAPAENVLAPPPTQTAPAAPAAQQPVAAATGGAAAYVQLASQRSEDAARQSAQSMMTRFGVLFGGANPEIQRADLGERGIYYRVLVPAASRADAANICTNIRAAGGDCLLP